MHTSSETYRSFFLTKFHDLSKRLTSLPLHEEQKSYNTIQYSQRPNSIFQLKRYKKFALCFVSVCFRTSRRFYSVDKEIVTSRTCRASGACLHTHMK